MCVRIIYIHTCIHTYIHTYVHIWKGKITRSLIISVKFIFHHAFECDQLLPAQIKSCYYLHDVSILVLITWWFNFQFQNFQFQNYSLCFFLWPASRRRVHLFSLEFASKNADVCWRMLTHADVFALVFSVSLQAPPVPRTWCSLDISVPLKSDILVPKVRYFSTWFKNPPNPCPQALVRVR